MSHQRERQQKHLFNRTLVEFWIVDHNHETESHLICLVSYLLCFKLTKFCDCYRVCSSDDLVVTVLDYSIKLLDHGT